MEYSLGEKRLTATAKENGTLKINTDVEIVGAPAEAATLSVAEGGTVLSAWESGEYELAYSDGKTESIKVSEVPEAIDLSTDWRLQCPKK